jgi:hypothetical protein
MQNAQILNLEPTPPRISQHAESSRVEEEFHSDDLSDDVIEETRSEIRGMRMLVHQHQEDHDRRIKRISMILVVLFLVFLAALWLVYPTLRDEKQAMADIFGLKNAAGGLGERMNSVETSVGKMTAGLPALVDQLQANMKSNMQSVHDQTAQAEQQIRAEMNKGLQGIQSRLGGVESNQKEASAHINQMQSQITQLNRELTSMKEQASASAAQLQQLKEGQATHAQTLSGLNEAVATNRTAIAGVTNRIDRQQVDFKVSKGQKTTQVTGNIDLTLKHVDVGKQEVDASLDLGGKNGDLPIRGQGLRKPVLFYMPGVSRPVELVFTEITKEGVSGYLLMPASSKTTER